MKVHQWLLEGLHEGKGDGCKGAQRNFPWATENALIPTVVAGYTSIYILVKTPSMGAFYYTFMRFCLNKADFLKKKEQIINLKKKNKKKKQPTEDCISNITLQGK